MSHKLASYLVEIGALQPSRVQKLNISPTDECLSPIAELIRLGEIDDEKLARWLSAHFTLPLVNLARMKIDDKAREQIPSGLLANIPCIPLGTDGDVIVIAIADPTVIPEIQKAQSSIQLRVEIVLTTFTAFWEAYRAEMADAHFWDGFSEVGDESTLININRG
jgi:hypothetical protein